MSKFQLTTIKMSIEETFAKSEKLMRFFSSPRITLHVNKALLSYHSDYFKKLFETDSGNEFPIEVTDLDVFATALSLIQNNPMKIEYWKLDKTVEIIDKFQLPAAKRHLELYF
uniref:BTB domain-containing protein n=2 Tax=Caenorhabditis tropicalis TaxID=1561998 RepID=A0A1I7UI57_9PELO